MRESTVVFHSNQMADLEEYINYMVSKSTQSHQS